MRIESLLPVVLLTLALAGCQPANPVLEIEGGKIQGVESTVDGVYIYKGIPFAAPPVGDLRWKEPQPVIPWEGVKVADTFGPGSVQVNHDSSNPWTSEFYWEDPEFSEDCLYLNVWTPAPGKPGKKLPVAMWIHGGAYMNGYGYEVTMDGDAWARRGVILVTINYRLGTFGFLSHPDLTAEQGQSGNYGTMDQVAALQWVHDNIAQFGGDPGNITVFGQSAGAMSVKTLLISPMAKDLMAKAIIQSGGGIGLRGLSPANDVPQSFYDEQGKALTDAGGLTSLEAMRAASAQTIFDLSQKQFVMLSPHNDGKVLVEDFDHALYDGSIAQVPVMIGYNKDDMGILAGTSVDRFCAVRDSLSCPVYEYEFLRELPTDEAHPASASGAFHSAELWYMFGTLKNSWRPFTEADYRLSEEMVDAWTAFCRTGNPGWDAYKHDKPYKKLFDIQ